MVDAAPGPLTRLRSILPGRAGRSARDVGTPPPPRVRMTKEDVRRLNDRFGKLDRTERRAIVRAVNRGEAMPRRRDAELAIGVARRQQRFWSRAWLLGPSIALIQVLVTPIGWLEGALLAAWGTLLLGMMAAWWWTRARRAELENLRVVGGRGGQTPGRREAARRGDDGAADARRRSRLPGGPARSASSADDADGPSADDGDPGAAGMTPRPPRPRGRKRR